MNHETTRVAEIKVGIFVIGALLVLIVGALWVTGAQLFRGRTTDYWVLMKSSGEVEVGDRVRMAGVTIGRINEIRLRPNEKWPVAFQVVLRSDIPIKTDSTARVVTSGLLGDGSLQIEPGSSDAPLLQQGGELLGQASPDFEEILMKMDEISIQAVNGLDLMTSFMNEVLLDTRPLLKNLKALLSEENITHIGKTLLKLEQTVDQSGPRFATLVTRLDSLSERLDKELEEVPRVMKTFSELGNDLRSAIGPNGIRLSKIIDRGEHTLTSVQESLSVIDGNREELKLTIKDLQVTASNLKAFSQRIKERPFSLIRIHPEPDRRPGQGLKTRKR